MPAGEAFTSDQRRGIDRARVAAGEVSGLAFHVFVGPSGSDPRAAARTMHSALPEAADAVLVLVDPPGRALEIVTGARAHRILDDSSCALVALAMQSAFAAGDLAGGLTHGLHQLGDHARRPQSLHTTTP